MQKNIRLFSLLLIFSLFPLTLLPQSMPLESFTGLQWRLVGPYRAGWGTVCEGIAKEPDTYYFGSAGGGIWKTSDAGRTWEGIMQHEGSSAIGALTIAPSDPDIIYAGTGQVAWRYDILEGDGVYKSTDGGQTWKNTGLKETGYIGKILVDPENPNTVVTAALGHVFGSSKHRGIYKSTDGGENWKLTLFVNDSTGAVDLVSDTQKPAIMYAALWQMRMSPWLDYYLPQQGLESGIYKSTDGGDSWKKIVIDSLKDVPLGRIGLATAGGNIVYATIDAPGNKKGLYRSDDGGVSWRQVNKDGSLANSYFSRLTLAPGDPNIVYVMDRSIRISRNGGKSFKIFKGSPGGDDYHYLWINPSDTSHMITASDQGTVVTVNGGKSWSSWYNQPTGQFYHLAADERFPYRIYSAQQDNGTVEIASRGPYGVIELRDWHPVGADERDMDIPKPGNPDVVFGSGLGGSLHRFDEITRQSINVSPWPHGSYAAKPNTVKYRYSWITPIAFSPVGNNALYFGAQYLFKSTDDGNQWDIVSPDLSRKASDSSNCEKPDLSEAAICGYGVIWDIAPSPIAENVIWVGTDDGLIQLTTDGGSTWKNVTPPEVPVWGLIDAISPSPFSVHTAYAAVNLHRLDQFRPLLLKTTDDGKSWEKITNGLPGDEYTTVIRTDLKKQGLLFAGTNRNVFVSFNDGRNWQSLALNFPTTLISDLLVHQNDLIAATQGRAIWILDDLNPLRQLNDNITTRNVYLFKPSETYRIRSSESHDTPWPPSTPLGENPPYGAIIDYWLKSDADSVQISIYDSNDNLVRTFNSYEPPESLSTSRYFDIRWLGKKKMLPAGKGLHRYTWDLRYPRPEALHYGYSIAAVWDKGTPVHPEGPLIIPGTYRIILRAGGSEYSQPLEVRKDPRVKTSQADFNEQLQFALKLDSVLNRTTELYRQVDKKLKAESGISKSETDSLKEIKSRLSKIDGALASLTSSVQTADTAPTQGVEEVFQAYSEQLNEIENKLK